MARDSSGEKYLILKEMGETIDMTFGRVHVASGEVDWLFRPHNISDGVGAFTDLLNKDGNQITEQPLMKAEAIPNFFSRLRLLFQHLKNMRKQEYDWRHRDTRQRGVGTSLAYIRFDKAATQALLDHSRTVKCSLNSVMLRLLNEVAIDNLLNSTPTETVWTIPLNLRGGATSGNASSNFTASISLRLPPAPTDTYIHEKIRTIYAQGVHWGAWLLSNMTRYVGKTAFRYLAEHAKPCWLGVFSNVGAWPPAGYEHPIDDDITYMGAPPVTSLLPVTACSMTWNQRMTLTLQLHSSISKDIGDTETMVQQWATKLAALANLTSDQYVIAVVPWSTVSAQTKEF